MRTCPAQEKGVYRRKTIQENSLDRIAFISYSHKDKKFVDTICNFIENFDLYNNQLIKSNGTTFFT